MLACLFDELEGRSDVEVEALRQTILDWSRRFREEEANSRHAEIVFLFGSEGKAGQLGKVRRMLNTVKLEEHK